jgi:hypothetical protein
MRGAIYDGVSSVPDYKTSLKLDYIEMPILLMVSPMTEGDIRPYVFAGRNIAFVISAKQKNELLGTPQEFDVKAAWRKGDLGITVGAELGLKTNMGMPFVGARYTMGLLKLMAGSAGAPLPDVWSGVIVIIAGYSFK